MCRVLTYLGQPYLLEKLLYKPDNSFVKQSYNPRYMFDILNLAGFGIALWLKHSYHPEHPLIYKSLQLPFYDKNLVNLSNKFRPHCVLAHLRGVDYSHQQTISLENVHPFIFEEHNIALAHNGDLYGFKEMKYDLVQYIPPHLRKYIQGTTDSEWIYTLFLAQLLKNKNSLPKKLTKKDIFLALQKMFAILKRVRKKNHLQFHSPMNLFISNGECIAAIRYVLDFGKKPPQYNIDVSEYRSLWYSFTLLGKKKSIIIASEPLTKDTENWQEVPEHSFLFAKKEKEKIIFSWEKIAL